MFYLIFDTLKVILIQILIRTNLLSDMKKQADYLLLYEQNWLKEGTEALVLKKTAESSK